MKIKPEVDIQIVEGRFPLEGIGYWEGKKVVIPRALKGQTVRARIVKSRKNNAEGRLLEVLEPRTDECAPPCPHFGICGGCSLQSLPDAAQTAYKEELFRALFAQKEVPVQAYEPMVSSPETIHYRTKMEYTFGDEIKGGPLTVGMHKWNRYTDIITTDRCIIVHPDFNTVLKTVHQWALDHDYKPFSRFRNEGVLRNLILRRGRNTGEVLAALCTTTYDPLDMADLTRRLQALELEGTLVGLLHIFNDGSGDVVKADSTELIFGRDWYMEEQLGLKFRVSFFSFFQTNTKGAELLYRKAVSLFSDINGKRVFDLFSGTGTIAQVMAAEADSVTAVELVEEAVEAAKANAALNGIGNCTFLAGDVFKVLSELDHAPECILVDPPRAGIMPKAWEKILSYGAEEIVYISCNPVSLAENLLQAAEQGYVIETVCPFDQFPHTAHLECVVKLCRTNSL